MSTIPHLGELLVKSGVLTPAQRDEVLLAQKSRGGPFGAVAEEMFGISPSTVEAAWAEQYSLFAAHIDPRTYDVLPRTLDVITRRQAWQFRVLPLKFQDNDILACTTRESLVRALRFVGWRLGHACHFVLADPLALGEALERHYPLAGMTARSVVEHAPA
jgi:hypothetical protein